MDNPKPPGTKAFGEINPLDRLKDSGQRLSDSLKGVLTRPKAPAEEVSASKPKFKAPATSIFSSVKNIFVSTQNVIGLDIGSSYIKIVQLQRVRKGYVITNCITRALPQSAKESSAEKKKLIREFTKSFIADARVKTNLGRLAVAGKGIFILSLNVPPLNKKDLRGAVSLELKKRLPFQLDLSNMLFDFYVTGQSRDEKGTSLIQVSCIAGEYLVLDEYVQMMKEMGIRPMAINAIPDALGNLLSFCLEVEPQKTYAVLDLGANTTLLNFYKDASLVFSREIAVGGDHLTRAMARSVTTSTGTVNIIPDEAEKIKRQCGIPLEDEARQEYLTDFGILLGEQITTMLRPTLERMVMEIGRTVNYYTKMFKSENIECLYLTGGGSRMRNIERFLLLNLPGMKKIEPLDTLKAVKGWADVGIFKQELVMEQAAPHLACAFGLCLAGGGRINLLPQKEKIEQKAMFLTSLLRISFPVTLALGLAFYAFSYTNAVKYKALNSRLDTEINRLEPIAHKVRDYMDIKTKLQQRKEVLDKAVGKQPLWWGVLKEISNITPQEVIISKITSHDKSGVRQARLFGKIFARYTIVDVALSQYLMTLSESPFFSNVELVSSRQDMYSPVPAADFEIACTLSY